MRKLILIYVTFLGLGITQAQTVKPIKNKSYTFGLLKNYYQDMNKIAYYPGFQFTIEKDKYQIIHQYLPAQLLDLRIPDLCDFIGLFSDRNYYQFALNYSIVKSNKLVISSGLNIRLLYGNYIWACLDKGYWTEILLDDKFSLESGLNTNVQYFPFSDKKLSKIGFLANINMMVFGANTYQMGICYKHISKNQFKNNDF